MDTPNTLDDEECLIDPQQQRQQQQQQQKDTNHVPVHLNRNYHPAYHPSTVFMMMHNNKYQQTPQQQQPPPPLPSSSSSSRPLHTAAAAASMNYLPPAMRTNPHYLHPRQLQSSSPDRAQEYAVHLPQQKTADESTRVSAISSSSTSPSSIERTHESAFNQVSTPPTPAPPPPPPPPPHSSSSNAVATAESMLQTTMSAGSVASRKMSMDSDGSSQSKKRKVDDEDDGIVINRTAVASLSHIPEILKSIIECGENVTNSEGLVSRVYEKFNPFFGKDVEVFYALSDEEKRPLFRPHELAKKFGIHSSRIGMYLNRKRDAMVNELYQATGFKHKSPNRMGIKVGAYFITEKACRMLQRWADNRRPRVADMPSTAPESPFSVPPVPAPPNVPAAPLQSGESPSSEAEHFPEAVAAAASQYPPFRNPVSRHPYHPDLKPHSVPPHDPLGLSRFSDANRRRDVDEDRLRAWYASVGSSYPMPFYRFPDVPVPSLSREAAAAAMAMLVDPAFYEYVVTRLRRNPIPFPYGMPRPSPLDSRYPDFSGYRSPEDRPSDYISPSRIYYKREPSEEDHFYRYPPREPRSENSAPPSRESFFPQRSSQNSRQSSSEDLDSHAPPRGPPQYDVSHPEHHSDDHF